MKVPDIPMSVIELVVHSASILCFTHRPLMVTWSDNQGSISRRVYDLILKLHEDIFLKVSIYVYVKLEYQTFRDLCKK